VAAVSAVVVNYNAGAELGRALESIAAELRSVGGEVVVVDNASSDGSHEVAARTPGVRLVRNADNVGFGRGVNQGIAASDTPFVLIVNPDCRLLPGALETLRAEIERHPGCAIAGPRILGPDGGVQGSARGDPDMLTGLFGRASALRRVLPWLPVSKRNVVDETIAATGGSASVDWVSGACMLARRDALLSVGGFDERYFLYWEDADLCRRLRHAGYHIRYAPGATAVHRVGQSSRTAPAASIRAFHASAYLYYATHVAPGRLDPKRPIAKALLAARCWWRLRNAKCEMQNANGE
jgi:GT2 family glycosyltransferase